MWREWSSTNFLPEHTLIPALEIQYVLTERNSSSYAGLSAFESCTPIYFNQTINDYQDAFAYRLWGGCKCSFSE